MTVNDLKRLDGINGDLIGKDSALLVGDGLAINGERAFHVIAHFVEEAIRVCGVASPKPTDFGPGNRLSLRSFPLFTDFLPTR